MTRLGSRPAWVAFSLALAVRLAHLALVAPTPLFELHRTFAESDMFMFDSWSRQLADGDWLGADVAHPLYAWQLDLAPEASWREWYGNPRAFYKAPFYPYLLAALRRFFGDPMLPVALAQCLASALAAALLVRIGERLFSAPAGFAAGLLFAVYGPAVHFDAVLLRGPWIALVALLGTSGLMGLAEAPTPRKALQCGAVIGLALLINEGFSLVPVLVLGCLAFWLRSAHAWLRGAGALAAGVGVALLPLVARNLAVGAPPFQLAVTGSIVYAVFNAYGASPWAFEVHPQVLAPLMEQAGSGLLPMAVACLKTFPGVASVGAFYLERLAGLAAPFENPDNANFYHAALTDPLLDALPAYGVLLPLAVAGALLSRGRRRALLPLVPFSLALLAAIALTTTLSRYRVVLAVFLFPFAGLALAALVASLRDRDGRGLLRIAAILLTTALAAQAAEAWLDRAGRLGALRYRPAEFYLASEGWLRRGAPDRALAELWTLVRHNRDPGVQSFALLQAARLLATQGEAGRAAETLALAVRAGGRNAILQLGVGDVRRDLLHDPAGAALAYRDALALAPPPPLAAQLEERLHSVAHATAVQ